MPDISATNGLNLWWVITAGTGIALALAFGFVLVVLYHERSNRELERKSELRYSELFHNVNDLVYRHTSDGIILELNQSAIALIGLPRQSIIGRSIGDFLPSRYKSQLSQYLADIRDVELHHDVTGVFPFARRDQTPSSNGNGSPASDPDGKHVKLLEYRSRVIKDAAGNITSVWGIARDRTENILQEKSLRKSHREIQDLYRQSVEMREELSRLSQKMFQMQEEDRLRISRELHDEVGQTLTAISTNLELIKRDLSPDTPDIRKKLLESQSLAKEVTQSVRRVVRELRPAAIDEVGLLPTLEKYTRDFESRTGIKTVFQYDPLEDCLTLNEKFTIYRIIQESLNNIAKHSGASEAQISLFERERPGEDANTPEFTTFLEITDNGCGMNSAGSAALNEDKRNSDGKKSDRSGPPQGGVGLIGMQERVKLLSGTFRIMSEPLKGVIISITLPRRRA